MPRLGDFIGALLSDATQARVRADLEALKIAETYSAHELLKHLPVPRFRMPDITVDFPVLVESLDLGPAGGKPAEPPTRDDIGKLVRGVLSEADVSLAPAARDKVTTALVQRARVLFEPAPGRVLLPARASGELSGILVQSVRDETDGSLDGAKAQELAMRSRSAFAALIVARLARSPSLQVATTSSGIKAHGDNGSVMHIRLAISEDAYEVVERDEGGGYTLTPE